MFGEIRYALNCTTLLHCSLVHALHKSLHSVHYLGVQESQLPKGLLPSFPNALKDPTPILPLKALLWTMAVINTRSLQNGTRACKWTHPDHLIFTGRVVRKLIRNGRTKHRMNSRCNPSLRVFFQVAEDTSSWFPETHSLWGLIGQSRVQLCINAPVMLKYYNIYQIVWKRHRCVLKDG